MTPPHVALLYWEDCPSHAEALTQLRRLLPEFGLDPQSIELREILVLREARDENFVGSPTIRVDGRDIAPVGDEPAALTCRLYRHRNGRYDPLPDDEDIRDALRSSVREAGKPNAAPGDTEVPSETST